jgi:NAD(P)-dependent dehydrogenase (short-subunit alcohol dehydrogenase family)
VTCAREGADVIIADIAGQLATVSYPMATQDDLDETVKLVEAHDRRALAIRADVRDQRGLPDRVIAELLAGLQRRTDAGLRTLPTSTRYLVKLLHAQRAESVLDLAQVPSDTLRSDARRLLRSLAAELYCLLSGPEKERARDVWQLQVFGLAGKLDFTGIT